MKLPEPQHIGESLFDRMVRGWKMDKRDVADFIAFIRESYDGPLYTRLYDEIQGYRRAWNKARTSKGA